MNKLHAMSVFVHVVQASGFKRAADIMQIPKATVSSLVQQLETDLAVKLLHRTTRHTSVTAEGAAYYEQCVRILADVSAVEESLSFNRMRSGGRLRVDIASSLAQSVIIPALPEFLDRYPDISVALACGDREADLIEEGVDCAIRFGELPDSGLIARRIGMLGFVTAAAPAYLSKHGRPVHPNQLIHHRCVAYFSSSKARAFPWTFVRGGERVDLPPPGPVSVNDAGSYLSAGLAGLGIVQLPAFLINAAGTGPMELLFEDWRSDPLPVHAVYPHNPHMTAKVRVFVDWIVELFRMHPEMQTGRIEGRLW